MSRPTATDARVSEKTPAPVGGPLGPREGATEADPAPTSAKLPRQLAPPWHASARIWAGRIVVLVLALGAWEVMVRQGILPGDDLSRPSSIASFLGDQIVTAEWWHHAWVTAQEVIIGVALGGGAGILVGAVLGLSKYLSDVVDPYITVLNSLPRLALFPLFLVWFGIGMGSKIALVIGLVFFIMLVNTRSGMMSADGDIMTATRVLGASRPQQIRLVSFPSAVPAIFGGLRLSIAYGLLAAVTGEMLASVAGLGQRLTFYSTTFDTTGVMGILVFLAVFAGLLDWLTGRGEKWLLRWREE